MVLAPATFAEALEQLECVSDPAELFGHRTNASGADGDEVDKAARRRFWNIAKLVHPDQHTGADADRATAAFARLSALWDAFENPTTGADRRPGSRTTGSSSSTDIVTRRGAYRLGNRLAAGDLANLYTAQRTPLARTGAVETVSARQTVVLKMPRDPRNNDLLENESRILTHLTREADAAYRAYLPNLVETFRHRDAATGIDRRVNALEKLDGFCPLTEVAAAYPGGLDARDVAWMWRRLLVALGTVHRAGVTHGAILPEHVLIHPEQHGLVLVDFAYASQGEPVTAIVRRYRDWYPSEVLEKQPPGPGTDIAMATRCMTTLMGLRAPQPLRAFARGCTLPSLRQRPDDAWRLLGELDDLLERLYGPRKYRPFRMPTTGTKPA